jgi:hypothetical protein
MNIRYVALVALVSFAGLSPPARAQTDLNLGTAANYGVLAGSTVTNTGNTVINGDLGLNPGTSVTGFLSVDLGPGIVTGTIDLANPAAAQAQADLTSAYAAAVAERSTSNLTDQDLGGQNLTSGVYTFSAAAQLTGTLTLNGPGVFIFQIGSTLTTAADSAVVLNGASASDVFWQVGTSVALLGSNSVFQGTVLASDSITVGTGVTMNGDLLAETAAVTLNGDHITAVPEPASTSILIAGFIGLAIGAGRIRRHYSDRKLDSKGC